MKLRWMVGFLGALAVAAAPAFAQTVTLYKLIDKSGKVTYVDKPPKDFDGQVIPMDVDPKRNSATLVTPGTPAGEQAFDARLKAQEAADQRVRAAQQRLDNARRALETARDNPKEDEVQRMGKAGGGSRPVFTESYEKRIAALEAEVKTAEDELRRAQRAR
jgi:hypothetical protein